MKYYSIAKNQLEVDTAIELTNIYYTENDFSVVSVDDILKTFYDISSSLSIKEIKKDIE